MTTDEAKQRIIAALERFGKREAELDARAKARPKWAKKRKRAKMKGGGRHGE